MARFSALLDACVLVPVALADTLLRVAEQGLYRSLWSARILDETVAAIEEVHPDLQAGAARRRTDLMDRAFQDASVSGWDGLLSALSLPDPDDAHVLAAAIVGRADVIVTLNLKDFPQTALEPYEIRAIGPDEFLLDQLDLAPDLVLEAVRRQAEDSRRPPVDLNALLEHLARCGVPQFAAAARARQWRIADR
ncbi:toxin PIN [Actinomyces radicidentis]|uniref:Toxin PIN n=1 Tax=Actinomyces radicidentis TaxID=111015 RepID=A0A109W2A9_ACTRD|nr:PIN domain-containing protein [Actinomyces radicidentis]AMD86871.1 toxin PIN [Actinomyces radicidentis]